MEEFKEGVTVLVGVGSSKKSREERSRGESCQEF